LTILTKCNFSKHR